MTTWTFTRLPWTSLSAIVLVRQENTPDAILIAHQRIGTTIPIVEIADETQLQRCRRPFAIPDAGLAVQFAAIEAEVMMALADLARQTAGGLDLSRGLLVMVDRARSLSA